MKKNIAHRQSGRPAGIATEDNVNVQDPAHRMVRRDGWHPAVPLAIEEVFLEGDGVVIVQHTQDGTWPSGPFNLVEGASLEKEPSP